jgi:ribosomal protein S18
MASSRRPALPPINKSSCDDHVPNYKDTDHLRKFLTAHGQILSRKRTGYCAQCQKALKQGIKRARHMGLLPFVG